ncbi:MAG: MBL fold metallo-hydrolase [Anaerolineales bacterium]|nr:MBL fold metallo-hydrolase [Anaerolineales bacterium]HNQ93420.1 MBL fold metallo-hydrolase [Anaerolineales bacterium]
MRGITMDRLSEKQKQLDRRRIEAVKLYPALWSKLIAQWKTPDPEDRVWLTYSANYLFRTNNIHWAIDPLTLHWRIKDAPAVHVAQDLSLLSFVLLTHEHQDHLDLDALSALRDLPIKWVVPEFILSKIESTGLRRENIIVPTALTRIEFDRIHILPFNGLHWETSPEGDLKGVPAMGYLIECDGKRWLFPGDTRAYDASQLPAFGSVDTVFAHLWLGRSSALLDEPPLLDSFCRFFLDLHPRRLILTHLNEFGRAANDLWNESHAQLICSAFSRISAQFSVTPLLMGNSVVL